MAVELGTAEVPQRYGDSLPKNQEWKVVIDPCLVRMPERRKVQQETKRGITASRAEVHQSRQSS